uniref:PAT1 homolog 1, processing body mRNA decay factor n=1 Tax=Oryzias latipes TaxID=8090 RepID=A0A3B3H6D4_ORYLA
METIYLEEDDGLVEEEDEIDQFNDDTFGAGAIDDDWQEEHKRLAELDERDEHGAAQPEEAEPGGAEPPPSSADPPSLPSSLGFSSSSADLPPRGRDSPLMSIIKEVGLPKRPLQGRTEEGWDLSERVPPPRSSSPVIGSPPVRAVPIGTPPKQPMSHALNHQVSEASNISETLPPQEGVLVSLSVSNSPLCRGPFPPRVLSQIQRAQLLNSQVPTVAGFHRGGPGPPLLPGGGFRPFFGGPPPPHGHRMGPPPPIPPIRHNTTHLHPQHRRLLTQRLQSRGGDRGRTAGDRRPRDPYSNLMSQKEKEWVTKIQMMQLQSTDPYLDDYYYQRQEKEQDSSSRKEHATKLITPQVAKVEHTYRPVQFAGSLGKLTVSSVNNPRKMIDAVVTSRSDDEVPASSMPPSRWGGRFVTLCLSPAGEEGEAGVEQTAADPVHGGEGSTRTRARLQVRLCSDPAPPRLQMFSLLLEVQDFEKRFVQTPEEERSALLEQHKTNTEQLSAALRDKDWEHRCVGEGAWLQGGGVADTLPSLSE